MSLYIGASFETFDELKQKVDEYEDTNYITLYMRDSKPLHSIRKMLPNKVKNINPALKYYCIYYRCTKGGKKFVSRGNGIRNRRSARVDDCPMYIKLNISQEGKLQVVAMNERHNHEINEEEHLNNPKKRKMNEPEEQMVKRLLNAGVKTNHIVDYIRKQSGKMVSTRDINNLLMKEKKKGYKQEDVIYEFDIWPSDEFIDNLDLNSAETSEQNQLQEINLGPDQQQEMKLEMYEEDDSDDESAAGAVANISSSEVSTSVCAQSVRSVDSPVTTKASAFCRYLATEMDNLPTELCDELIEQITLKLFEIKKSVK